MGPGIHIIHWTVRVALLCYAATVLLLLMGFRGSAWRGCLRGLWTIGCVAFLAHVAAAFHYAHHWSHAEAIQSTAQQTRDLIGWAFGEGLYFSYLFMILWVADVLWYWLGPAGYEQRPRWMQLALHLYLFFIAFNGAVIFESGVTRPAGVAVTLLLAAVLIVRRRNAARPTGH